MFHLEVVMLEPFAVEWAIDLLPITKYLFLLPFHIGGGGANMESLLCVRIRHDGVIQAIVRTLLSSSGSSVVLISVHNLSSDFATILFTLFSGHLIMVWNYISLKKIPLDRLPLHVEN